ncbi:AAA family ATPase [Promicromonospora sukumoe]
MAVLDDRPAPDVETDGVPEVADSRPAEASGHAAPGDASVLPANQPVADEQPAQVEQSEKVDQLAGADQAAEVDEPADDDPATGVQDEARTSEENKTTPTPVVEQKEHDAPGTSATETGSAGVLEVSDVPEASPDTATEDEGVPSSVDMAPPAAEIQSGTPRDEVWGQDRPDPEGRSSAVLSQLIESVTKSASTDDEDATEVAEALGNEAMTEVVEPQTEQAASSPAPDAAAVPDALAEDPDLMEELPSNRPVPADAIKRATEALDAAVNAAPAVIGSTTMTFDDELGEVVDAEFTHFDGETAPGAEPEDGASDYSVRVTDPIPVQGLSAPGVSRETPGSAQTLNGTQQPTGGPHGGDDERRSALIATVPAVDETTPVAAELAMDARRRIELQGRKFPRPPKTRIITVANQKGGVGKTTTTVNIAAGLAQSGLNVLVIDNDPQGNASTALGIEHRAGTPSVYEILVEGEPLANTVQQCPDVPNLWGVPATIDLSGSEIELISLVSRETRLRKALDKYLEDRVAAGEERIDYVLIDCPPSLGLLTVNAFVAGREVFIPVQCEYYALEGLSQLLKTIDLIRSHLNPELRVSSILLTMYDGRTNLAQQVAGEVRSHFPAETFKTTIPRSVRISEAPSYGQTVMTYDPTSTGALAYLQSSRELAERGQGGSSPRRMKAETVGAQD